MEYSLWKLDDLMKYSHYKELCDMFLNLAKDDETKEKLESILYYGGYKDYCVSSGTGMDSEFLEIRRRLSIAYLIIRNPETFDEIVNNKITYYHGTNAMSLPSILKHGINSHKKSIEEGIEVKTGEKWSRIENVRDFISFTDVLDVAGYYSKLGASIKSKLSFPVIFGTSKENLFCNRVVSVPSAEQEIGVKDNFPKEYINCIMVPSSKVKMVKKMVGDSIPVLPIDDIYDRFYFVDDVNLIIIREKYQELIDKIQKEEDKITGVKESILSRSISKITNIKDRFMGSLKGEAEYERISR